MLIKFAVLFKIPIQQFAFLKALSNTSGIFEKAKQFVCRVFGGGSSSSSSSLSSLHEDLSNKRLISQVNSVTDHNERKKLHTNHTDLQFQPTSISLSSSQSYTSLVAKSPPPTPEAMVEKQQQQQPIIFQSSSSFHTNESSLSIQSVMMTQIHSILDNIDSVLNKIEAQTNSANQSSTCHENHLQIEPLTALNLDIAISQELPNASIQQNTDQITQTAVNTVERHLNMNDGSGDTSPTFIDLLDIVEESSLILSSESSEEIIDSFH